MKMRIMLSVAVLLMTMVSLSAQPADTYTQKEGKTFVTRYYDDGTVRESGSYDGKLLDGQWMEYSTDGKLKTQAYFENGQKEGKWYVWTEDGQYLYEVIYQDNLLVDSHKWKIEERSLLAIE